MTPKPLASCCGWCPSAKERTAELHAQGYAVSHTICPECRKLWLGEIGKSLLKADEAAAQS